MAIITQRELAYNEALQVMNKGNSNLSSSSNMLLSILEGAEGTLGLREKITAYFNSLSPALPINLNDLQKKGSIKEKLAYLVSLNTLSLPSLPATPVDRNGIINSVNYYIELLDKHILKKEDFSESSVIRLSALNSVNIKLTSSEKAKLASIGKRIADSVKGDKNLTADLNLNNENDAQKIYKLKTLINGLIKKGKLSHDNADVTAFQTEFEPKLKELQELDNNYHTLNLSRNAFYRIQRNHGTVKVLNKKEYGKLSAVLTKLAGKDIGAYFKDVFNKQVGDSTELDSSIIESELLSLKSIPGLTEALKEAGIREGDFDRYYLFYFSQELLKKAKVDFDNKKRRVFGDKLRDFEGDMNTWRKMQRDRIIEFSRADDINSLVNIFDRDRKLFVLKKSFKGIFKNLDADDNLIVEGLRKVINEKYPTLSPGNQKSLVNTILCENSATNELYYGDTNRLLGNNKESTMQDVLKLTNSAGRGIQTIEKWTTPLLRGLVKFGQGSLEFVGKQASNIVNGTTGKVGSILGGMNTKLQSKATTKWGKVLKLIPQSALLLTKPLEWGVKGTNFVTTKTTGFVGEAYTGLNENIKKASDGKIDDIFDILTKSYSKSLSLLGQGTEITGDKGYEWLDNKGKRKILEDFYESRTSQDVRNVLDAIDIQSKLQDSSPYIFGDEEDDLVIDDGLTDKVGEKEMKEVYDYMAKKIGKLNGKIDGKITNGSNPNIIQSMKELKELFAELEQESKEKPSEPSKNRNIIIIIQKIQNWIGIRAIGTNKYEFTNPSAFFPTAPIPPATTPSTHIVPTFSTGKIGEFEQEHYSIAKSINNKQEQIEKFNKNISDALSATSTSGGVTTTTNSGENVRALRESVKSLEDDIKVEEKEFKELNKALIEIMNLNSTGSSMYSILGEILTNHNTLYTGFTGIPISTTDINDFKTTLNKLSI